MDRHPEKCERARLSRDPWIYGWRGGEVSIDTYFVMARGTHDAAEDCASHKHINMTWPRSS